MIEPATRSEDVSLTIADTVVGIIGSCEKFARVRS